MQFVAGQRLAQFGGQLQARARFRVHQRRVETHAVALFGLRRIHRGVGIGDQRRRIERVERITGDADARADRDFVVVDAVRLGQRRKQAVRQTHRVFAQAQAAHQHGELVAADAAGDVERRKLLGDARGGRRQQAVADGVAVAVVDDLERVEIDEEHRHGLACLLCRGDRAVAVLFELHAIDQPGQRVVPGQIFELQPVRFRHGDVGDDRDIALHPSLRIADDADAQPFVVHAAVAPARAHFAEPGAGRGDLFPYRRRQQAAVRQHAHVVDAPVGQLLRAEAGQRRVRGVDRDHAPVRIGDDDALGDGGERLGGDAALLLERETFGDVADDRLAHHAVLAPVRETPLHFDRPRGAVDRMQFAGRGGPRLRGALAFDQIGKTFADQFFRFAADPFGGRAVGVENQAVVLIDHDDRVRRAVEQHAVALLGTADLRHRPPCHAQPNQRRHRRDHEHTAEQQPRRPDRAAGDRHGKQFGSRLNVVVQHRDARDFFRQAVFVPSRRMALAPQLLGDRAQFVDRLIGGSPGLERLFHERRLRQVAEHEDHHGNRIAHRIVVAERLHHGVVVVILLERLVAREAVVAQQGEVAVETGQRHGIAVDRVGLDIHHDLLLCLRPDAFAVEKRCKRELHLQHSPHEAQQQADEPQQPPYQRHEFADKRMLGCRTFSLHKHHHTPFRDREVLLTPQLRSRHPRCNAKR